MVIFRKWTILRKLIVAFVIFILAPLMILGIYTYGSLKNNIVQNYNNENKEILRMMDKSMQLYFSDFWRLSYNSYFDFDSAIDIQDILNSDNNDQAVRFRNQKAFDNYIRANYGYRSDVEGVYLVCKNGYIYSNSLYGNLYPENELIREEWFESILARDEEVIITSPHKQNYKKKSSREFYYYDKVYTFARKIKSTITGEFIGTLMINLKPELFNNIYEGISKDKKNIVVVEENGMIYYDQREENIMDNFTKVYGDFTVPAFDINGFAISSQINGNYLISYKSKSDRIDLIYTIIVPEEKLYSQINKTTRPFIICLFGGICIFVMFAVIIAKNIADPIKKLEIAMDGAFRHEFKNKIELQCGGEIENLANGFNLLQDRIRTLIIQVYEAQLSKKDFQLKALHAQIKPHFLYNTLETINSVAMMKGDMEVSEMICSLASLFRYTVRNDNGIVSLREEIAYIKHYILLQGTYYEENVSVDFQIPEELMESSILKFVLQPVVENSFVHGLDDLSHIRIQITARTEEEKLVLSVKDNGCGINKEELQELHNKLLSQEYKENKLQADGKSIGILNIHTRIKLNYGDEYGIEVMSESGEGTIVNILLPLLKGVR